ncbi:MAG: cell division protein FtsZ, partial [Rubellimicrobium sp.]|nr:cell division protein FtsZ [Rubellimicrobium sp.]
LIIIPNQNLFRLANERTTFTEAFAMADDVLYQGVKGVTDLMVRPGLINLDFADVRAVMDEMGKAMMGTGEAEGEDRALHAAEKAIANPLLDEISLRGAKGVLINITGGYDLTLFELDEAANKIREEVDPEANIIVGSTLDPSMEGVMRVSVVATGIDAVARESEVPVPRRQLSQPLRETVSIEEQVPEPAAVAARAPEPAVAAMREPAPVASHRGLFDDPIFDEPAATDAGGADEAAHDGLPPPAYNPQRARAPEPRAADPVPEPRAARQAEDFVAPRPPAGTPSAEALARLQNAMRRPADTPRAPAPDARAPRPEVEKPRFGLNSLINRMTGTGHAPQAAADAWHDEADAGPEAAPDEERDRIEIPAFLRRQAN